MIKLTNMCGDLVQVFDLILDRSVGLWEGIRSAGEWVPETDQIQILVSLGAENLSPFDSKSRRSLQKYVWIHLCV